MERNLLEREIAALGGAAKFPRNIFAMEAELKSFPSKFPGKTKEMSYLREEDLKTKQTVDKKTPYFLSNQWIEILGEDGDWFLVEGDAFYTEKGKEKQFSVKLQGYIKKSWVIYQTPAKLDEEPRSGKTKTGEYTVYAKIDLGITDKAYRCYVYDKDTKKSKQSVCYTDAIPDKMTAVYVPKNFKPEKETDMIIYLHGFQDGIPGMVKSAGKTYTPSIQAYLNYADKPYFGFRRLIDSLGKNVVFVAPTLGAKAQYGKLASGFDNFVDQIIWAIDEYALKERGSNGKFKLRNIILAAHSGGGSGMLAIAQQTKSVYAKRIKEYWGFDSWYNGSSPWNAIAKDKSVNIYAYWFDSSGVPKEDKKTVFVTAAAKDESLTKIMAKGESRHFALLPFYFEERLKGL